MSKRIKKVLNIEIEIETTMNCKNKEFEQMFLTLRLEYQNEVDKAFIKWAHVMYMKCTCNVPRLSNNVKLRQISWWIIGYGQIQISSSSQEKCDHFHHR